MGIHRRCNIACGLELSNIGEEMKIYKILFVAWGVALFAFNVNALTCATDDTVYYIHYSCGDGTLADGQTLPEPTPVKYNQTVTPQLIKSQCVGPYDGYEKWAGYQIVAEPRVVDEWGYGEPIVADVLSKTVQSFVYKYTRDIIIQPRWVDSLGNERELVYGGMEYSATNGVRGEWEFTSWGGYTYGVSFCGEKIASNTASDIALAMMNSASKNWIMPEYNDTEAGVLGPVCYCNENACDSYYGRGWVQVKVYETVDACSAECATTCGKSMMDAVKGLPIRRAITAQCRVES